MGQVATPAQFRIKFDVPHSFCVEPGFSKDQHCHDMRPDKGALINTWQDPITGLVLLRPSFLTENYYTPGNWHPLTDWIHDAAYWQSVFGNVSLGSSVAGFFSTVLAGGSVGTLIPDLSGVPRAVAAIASSLASDVLHWVLQSSFSLPGDGGFVWHYHAIGDENHRYKNWFVLQFDDLALHFSYDGSVSLYQYGSDVTVAPTLIERAEIASPGDVANKNGYFIVIPVPGMGINVYHSLSPQRIDARSSSAVSGVTRGHQFKMARTDSSTGLAYVHKGGTISVGIGANLNKVQHKFGYHKITYPTGTDIATFADGPMDIGYQPTHAPTSASQAVLLPGLYGSGAVNIGLNLPGTSTAWTPTSDPTQPHQQAQVALTISNADADHTPFISSYYVHWDPVFLTRATTATLPDMLHSLEFTDDDLGHFEGSCTTFATSDAYRLICERGDTTFLLEKSLDGGTTWTTHNGGLAQLAAPVEVYLDTAGIAYIASWTLVGKEGRFKEGIHTIFGAYDGLTPGAAINKTLQSCGEPVIASLPAGTTAHTLPNPLEGQNFRFAPRLGESGDDLIKSMLLLCRTQNKEYRVYYDWGTAAWKCDAKPRDTSSGATWIFTPYEDEIDLDSRYVNIAAGDGRKLFDFMANPPEGNLVIPYGATSPEPRGGLIPGTALLNSDSLSVTTSPDYLGRTKIVSALFAPISDVASINIMGRRIYDAAAHRRLQPTIIGREYIDALKPGLQVYIRTQNAAMTRGYLATAAGAPIPTGFWLKRRTTSLQYNGGAGIQAPTVTYTLDTIWESDLL